MHLQQQSSSIPCERRDNCQVPSAKRQVPSHQVDVVHTFQRPQEPAAATLAALLASR